MDFLRFVQAVKKLRENIESPIAAHCRFAVEHFPLFLVVYCLLHVTINHYHGCGCLEREM